MDLRASLEEIKKRPHAMRQLAQGQIVAVRPTPPRQLATAEAPDPTQPIVMPASHLFRLLKVRDWRHQLWWIVEGRIDGSEAPWEELAVTEPLFDVSDKSAASE